MLNKLILQWNKNITQTTFAVKFVINKVIEIVVVL